MRYILGLNAAGFNTSASLFVDGEPIFAVQEERLIREKLTRKFPSQGIHAALEAGGIGFDDLDAIAVSWNPLINLEAHSRVQSGSLRYLPEMLYSIPSHLMSLSQSNAGDVAEQKITLEGGKEIRAVYVRHHLAHAASFYCSPFDQAAILTTDAFGEKECVTFSLGQGNTIQTIWSQEFPHSLGGFYSTFTEFLGFRAQSDEWKIMGACAYGDADRYYEKVRSLVNFVSPGFELDLRFFNFYQFHRPGRYTEKLARHLNLRALARGEELSQPYYDLAAAVQKVTEEIYFHLLHQLKSMVSTDALVLAGGVAFNSLANGKVIDRTPFQELFLPPVPGDSGAGFGAGLYVHHQMDGAPRRYTMHQNYLGPGFTNEQIESDLRKFHLSYERVDDPAETAAQLVSDGNIIGWFQGRLEFGDRALGNRSILANPCDPNMKDKVNATIKYREHFRPFAPSILAERVHEYFVNASATPFMEKVFEIQEEKRATIPAVTHEDGTGRLQTVSQEHNPLYWRLIHSLEQKTGSPVVLNTSFNVKGEPIVCSPSDAIRTFYTCGLDALVIGNFVLKKQPSEITDSVQVASPSKCVVIIPAKGGSRRLPKKNLANLNGRPMIDYAIDQAKACAGADAIYVTTDSPEIAAHARARGIEVIMRPTSLGGETPLLDVYRHALAHINDPSMTTIIGLQVDHPDRNMTIDQALGVFEQAGTHCDLLFSTEADGTKNGAHYILSGRFVETGEAREKVCVVDDCTNVHYQEDLARAAARLRERGV